ncbi:hypothetical protein M011DRAFT_402069 [Sporormia fimetaria CBS 119925]|uniref:F-box domain-containing protein n=1 Tax=Sporormia fimetaria CBS 119925 TaxID=1340428 RepID=A0A6A6VDV1_9PLEO|nr:hypothetical protein M011DRAFT_402069 [Sporormia fimetaria CBS 119925]
MPTFTTAEGRPLDDGSRLSPVSPRPRNRISEYENASSPVPKRETRAMMFEVVQRPRKPGDQTSPISKLPDEILTHVLAHLSPANLAAASLLSKRFNEVATTPHAWMIAFARYFPGPDARLYSASDFGIDGHDDAIRSERRAFTRLTALASWRSEYIVRTRLLRSLMRGRPNHPPVPPNPNRGAVGTLEEWYMQLNSPILEFAANSLSTVNHLHATFSSAGRVPLLMHGADDVGMVTSTSPTQRGREVWGEDDPIFFSQFSERFPGDREWGLGAGDIVGCRNVMDVSQPHGMIYGQGCPEGTCYYRSVDENRGRFVARTMDFSRAEVGIPKLGVHGGAICSVWIAKTPNIPTQSDGLIGLLIGSAAGVVSACTLGTDGLRGERLERGTLTARWVLSPGVPIIALAVDENYSARRLSRGRIWAVALNALGELFYLTKFPKRTPAPREQLDEQESMEYIAWQTGRTVYWNLVESTRRVARPDPYQDLTTDHSQSPRSSWDGMSFSKAQLSDETREVERFLKFTPKHFRKFCLGWDMRRRLEVDFAGDDGNDAGEALLVFDCGLDEGTTAGIRRFTRWRVVQEDRAVLASSSPAEEPSPKTSSMSSLFGGPQSTTCVSPSDRTGEAGLGTQSPSPTEGKGAVRRSSEQSLRSLTKHFVEEWRCSLLSLESAKSVQLSATAMDQSTYAVLTMSEDPALGLSTASTTSSPYASPLPGSEQPVSPLDIPGQRARFVAVGTKTGSVFVWNVRSSVPRSATFINTIEPVRIIHTDSPEIACIALTALYLVHGGNDGLVQAWDVLASTLQPIKTLNSRFSTRARRRIAQAQASAQGVGINMFAAGAICLDPDPTALQGAVSLGGLIRFWSFNSSGANQFKGGKRRLRRGDRSSTAGGERYSRTRGGNIESYIESEKYELEREEKEQRQQAARLAGRFGVDLLDNEDEALAYATLLSQEALANDELRRREVEAKNARTEAVPAAPASVPMDEEVDPDIAEAIRQSLEVSSPVSRSPSPIFDIPVKIAKTQKGSSSKAKASGAAGMSTEEELSDLEFAIQLSLAEEQSRKELLGEDEFPPLSPSPGDKGKGKGRML